MSEQINIQIVTNSLRSLAKAWAEANRQSQLNKERRQRVQAEAERLRKPVEDAKPWPGAVPESEKKEDPAAYRNRKFLGFGCVANRFATPGEIGFRIYSGNGKSFVEWTEPARLEPSNSDFPNAGPPVPAGGEGDVFSWVFNIDNPDLGSTSRIVPFKIKRTGYFGGLPGSSPYMGINRSESLVLPVTEDVFIYVRRRHENHVRTIGWGVQTIAWAPPAFAFKRTGLGSVLTYPIINEEHCFVVSHRAVRRISPPSALLDYMRYVVPEATGTRTVASSAILFTHPLTGWIGGISPEAVSAVLTYSGVPEAPERSLNDVNRYGMWPIGGPGQVGTPGVYSAIANPTATSQTPAEDLTAYGETAPFPSRWLFPCVGPAVCDVGAERYEYAASGSVPAAYSGVYDPDSEWVYRRAKERYKGKPPTDLPDGWSVGDRFVSWDWGNPSYCRQQLLALGFSPSDLVP
jgi:hypothetical protein